MTERVTETRSLVRAMRNRWLTDEARLKQLFGADYDGDNFADYAEMQRNLGTAIAYANGWLSAHGEKGKCSCCGSPDHSQLECPFWKP